MSTPYGGNDPQQWGQQPYGGGMPNGPASGGFPAQGQEQWAQPGGGYPPSGQHPQQPGGGYPPSGPQQQPGPEQQWQQPQQQWGPPGPGQQQWQQPQPGGYPGQFAQYPQPEQKKSKAPLWIGLGVLVLLLVAVAVLGFVAPGFFNSKVFDKAAVERGVEQIRPEVEKGATSCPADQKVEKDHTFTCTVKVNGEDKQVQIKVVDEEKAQYEVGPVE